jgi:hypothetical protein
VIAYDPLATENARRVLGGEVRYAATAHEALKEADVVVVANPDPAFAGLQAADFSRRPVVLFDCWRILRQVLEGAPGIEYVAQGLGGHDARLANQLIRMHQDYSQWMPVPEPNSSENPSR